MSKTVQDPIACLVPSRSVRAAGLARQNGAANQRGKRHAGENASRVRMAAYVDQFSVGRST
jgi:hypothetical protein